MSTYSLRTKLPSVDAPKDLLQDIETYILRKAGELTSQDETNLHADYHVSIRDSIGEDRVAALADFNRIRDARRNAPLVQPESKQQRRFSWRGAAGDYGYYRFLLPLFGRFYFWCSWVPVPLALFIAWRLRRILRCDRAGFQALLRLPNPSQRKVAVLVPVVCRWCHRFPDFHGWRGVPSQVSS